VAAWGTGRTADSGQPEVSPLLHPSRQQFQIRIEQEGTSSSAVLHLTGEMDLTCEGVFTDAVHECLAHGSTDLLLDLSNLTFIDSSGLRLLIELWEQSRQDGLEVVIVQGNGQVRRILEFARADQFLPIVDRGSSRS
jgi:anti-sigma B factor antagonist